MIREAAEASGGGPRRPGVFLDRDGVLNEVVWRDGRPASPRALAELRIVPEAPEAVARIRSAGIPVFVITNQPDVARGLLSEPELASVMRRLGEQVEVDDAEVCPHDDGDGCDCRKPRPGMLHALAERWNVDLTSSYVVGDSSRDVEAGRAAGCTTILLRRPYNATATGDHIVRNLTEAADIVLAAPPRTYSELYLREAQQLLGLLDWRSIEHMVGGLEAVRERGGRVFFMGVGGGAGHATHAACDFRKIAGFEAYAVSDNVSELTARANDEGWDTTYAEYLRGSRLTARDAVFVFSVGGGDRERGISANLVRAVAYAKEVGASIFGVVGRDGGETARLADGCVLVPTVAADRVTPHTESVQALVWHLLVSHPRLQRSAMKWESVVEARP